MDLKIKIFLIISCLAMASNEFPAHEYFDRLETIEYRLHNGQRDETAYINASSFVDWAYFSFNTNSEVNIVNPETSLDWDLAFKRNHVKTNSGLSGQGLGGAYVDTSSTWPKFNKNPDNERKIIKLITKEIKKIKINNKFSIF